ncbi:MAG TPA: ribosome maturation factor RimM [Alphaproteobacteria bacterium]|nr:ribosome maturation factor RimM [Alphaproteobacteria bacterium]
MSEKKITIAKILTAHGVRGFVKLRVFLEDPYDISEYDPIRDDKGRSYKIKLKNPIKGDWVAEIEGITDRNDAEKLRGLEFYITRDQLPETEEGEIYIEDLIGCDALDKDGTKLGIVVDFQNFGASDLIEIKPASGGKTYYLPMIEPYVGEIDIEKRTIIIEPAEEFMA